MGIVSAFSNKLGKSSQMKIYNFLQMRSRITSSHIILYHLTLNGKKEHQMKKKLNNY